MSTTNTLIPGVNVADVRIHDARERKVRKIVAHLTRISGSANIAAASIRAAARDEVKWAALNDAVVASGLVAYHPSSTTWQIVLNRLTNPID